MNLLNELLCVKGARYNFPPFTLLVCLLASMKGGDLPLLNLCIVTIWLFALLQCGFMLCPYTV